MNDRELLEMAAKAAGVFLTPKTLAEVFPKWKWDADFEIRHELDGGLSGTVVVRNYEGELSGTTRELWNPLNDDGDALRLAVRLGLEMYHSIKNDRWAVFVGYALNGRIVYAHEDWWDDPYAATRRAIVRSAAEIGKGMHPFPTVEEIKRWAGEDE